MIYCKNHLSLMNTRCRSQTLVSVASELVSSEISESLLNSAVWLFIFRKTNIFLVQISIPACNASHFSACYYFCNFWDWALEVLWKNIYGILSHRPYNAAKSSSALWEIQYPINLTNGHKSRPSENYNKLICLKKILK